MRPEGARASSGRRIGARYELGERVGAGAYGVVFQATDTVTGRQVAVKIFNADAHPCASRSWREAAVLRRMNLPGVVRLLDEGREGDRPYLVMPFVDGQHFPGRPNGGRESYADVIVPLVELLNCVHAAGIVHGDLKPQNVLVDDDGQVTLLDFGTGSWVAGLSSERYLERAQGTPAYMAPEQLRGRPATVQSDYYALGVMLYQTLTGEFPHPFDSLEALMRSRLNSRAPRLDAEAHGISAKLARAVEGLLAPAADRRTEHLGELLEALDADQQTGVAPQRLAYLDPHDVVDRVVEAIEQGESVDITGRRGSGRTRCLHEVVARLRASGRRVTTLHASTKAFDSLRPLVGRTDTDEGSSLELHRQRLREALESGKVVVADNFEQLDHHSRRLLSEERHRGGVICARLEADEQADGQVVELGPLTMQQMVAFFDGPELIFRLRSQAARELWLRTGGVPRAAVRTIELWVRHGLAHFRGDKVVVPPQQLERLRRGLRLEPGASGKLSDLDLDGEDAEVVAEARVAARQHDYRGETGMAIAALSEAMSVCRRLDDFDAVYEVLADWTKVALSTEEAPRIEELLYAIERVGDDSDPRFVHLRRLVALARLACQRADADVLEQLSELEPFADWELELRRQMYRVRIGVRSSTGVLEAVLQEVDRWSQRPEVGREARGSFTGWQGMLAYKRGDYSQASSLYLEAAQIKRRPSAKLASIISAVTALMDGLEYQLALEHAQAALARAERLHRHRDQAHCHYLLRSLRYRLGMPLGPADELYEALELLGSAELTALTRMVDAADAFRRGDRSAAASAARDAYAAFDRAGNRLGQTLSGALAVRCEEKVDPDEAGRLAGYARDCPAPRIAVQILGLLLGARGACSVEGPEWADLLGEMVEGLPEEDRHKRLEVISIEEAIAAAEAR